MTPTSNHNIRQKEHPGMTLYIFWLLHQTTTTGSIVFKNICCISFDSYIKPQPPIGEDLQHDVVYLLTPTSNHNWEVYHLTHWMLYIFWLLHQTTTYFFADSVPDLLYIFWLLHQTTTLSLKAQSQNCCISFDSYIKPQQTLLHHSLQSVVYLLTPTSNHNGSCCLSISEMLYIFWLLHQTTTLSLKAYFSKCCISFDSYIKPQPLQDRERSFVVVYLLTPTSNHNLYATDSDIGELYIFWLLHQTTTVWLQSQQLTRCISFDSYIKPQLKSSLITNSESCISFDSYIKPQLSSFD